MKRLGYVLTTLGVALALGAVGAFVVDYNRRIDDAGFMDWQPAIALGLLAAVSLVAALFVLKRAEQLVD